jgi:hypothetical protein
MRDVDRTLAILHLHRTSEIDPIGNTTMFTLTPHPLHDQMF